MLRCPVFRIMSYTYSSLDLQIRLVCEHDGVSTRNCGRLEGCMGFYNRAMKHRHDYLEELGRHGPGLIGSRHSEAYDLSAVLEYEIDEIPEQDARVRLASAAMLEYRCDNPLSGGR